MTTSVLPASSTGELQKILRSINLLGSKSAEAAVSPSDDPGVDVLESTATAITRLATPAVAAVGGLSVAGTALATFWSEINTPVRVTMIAGLSLVIAVAAVSIALLVSSDVRSRAVGQAAIYRARQDIAIEFMRLAHTAISPTPEKEPPSSVPATPDADGTLELHLTMGVAGDRLHGFAKELVNGGAKRPH